MSLPLTYKIGSAILIALALAGGVYVLNRNESAASSQSTDDAYVRADFTMVAPQVPGILDQVLVEDNQQVRKGQLLATIDDREYRIAVDSARARLEEAKASSASLRASIAQQDSLIAQARAAIAASSAALSLAQANQARYRNLSSDGSGTVQEREQADAQLRIQMASRQRDQAALSAAQQQIAVLQAIADKAEAETRGAEAALRAQELRLSYTRITAAVDGTVGERTLRVGRFVNVGQPLLAIVPLDKLYIEANFRETQLEHVAQGQHVSIGVDTLPGVTLRGRVDSIAPASGVTFSPIAPDNATGNFTKVVQRLNVKITLDPGQDAAKRLKVGMSVRPVVRTRTA